MTPELFNIIYQILSENTVTHTISISDEGVETNNYTVCAVYNTNGIISKNTVFEILHTPSKHNITIYCRKKRIYSQKYVSLRAPGFNPDQEIVRLNKILNLCKSKAAIQSINQLQEIQQLLQELKVQNKEK